MSTTTAHSRPPAVSAVKQKGSIGGGGRNGQGEEGEGKEKEEGEGGGKGGR